MKAYWIVQRDNEGIRLYIGEFATYAEACRYAAFANSRDWRVTSHSGV